MLVPAVFFRLIPWLSLTYFEFQAKYILSLAEAAKKTVSI